jgi:general secretion pathway protein D
MKNKKAVKFIKIILILAILNFQILPLTSAQEDNEALTKYTIKQYLESNLPPEEGRKIMLDEITGLLTITDTPSNQQIALKLIREWDVGPKQIQIEAKFVEITFTDLDEMGVDWDLFHTDEPMILSPHSANFVTTGTASVQGLMGTASSAAAWAQAANTAGLGFLISKTAYRGWELMAYLKLLAEKDKVNLIHAPKVTTLSGQMANIQVVRSFPYATSSEITQVQWTTVTGGTTTTAFYPVETYKIEEEIVGVLLEVTPTVMEGSDIITLDIHPEITKLSQQVALTSSSTFPSNLGWPIIDTRTAQTSVMIRSGNAILIGGLIQDKDDSTVKRQVPILSDLPLIGPLFKYEYEKVEKKNLVVVLTATLIDTEGEEVVQ